MRGTLSSIDLSVRRDGIHEQGRSCRAPSRRRGTRGPNPARALALRERPTRTNQSRPSLRCARHRSSHREVPPRRACQEDLLDISFKRLSERRGPGAGRPTKLYARSNRQLSVILPDRRYALAGHLLAGAIDNADARGTAVADALNAAAAGWGRSVADQARAAVGPRPSPGRLSPAPARL